MPEIAHWKNEKEEVVSIRGSKVIDDWLLRNFPISLDMTPIRYHHTRNFIKDVKRQAGERPVTIVGHSLGAMRFASGNAVSQSGFFVGECVVGSGFLLLRAICSFAKRNAGLALQYPALAAIFPMHWPQYSIGRPIAPERPDIGIRRRVAPLPA